MNKEIKKVVDLFLKNSNKLRKEFKFEGESNYLLGGLLYAAENKIVDVKYIKDCYKILKENTGFLSDYRTFGLPLILEMSLNENPLNYFNDVRNTYEILNSSKFFGSYYKIIASLIICDNEQQKNIKNLLNRFNYMYDKSKKYHPILTGEEDIPFNILFAMSNKDKDKLVDKAEECYQLLRNRFSSKDEIQSLGQILALSDESATLICERFINFADKLKDKKKNIDNQFLSIYGTLMFLDIDGDLLIDEILSVDQYLGSKKGVGGWSGPKMVRLAFAASLIEIYYGCDKSKKMTPILNAIIREQIASLIAVDMLLLT